MVHTAFQGIADGLLSTDSLLKISAMRNILGYSIVVVCISILINKSSPLQVCLLCSHDVTELPLKCSFHETDILIPR